MLVLDLGPPAGERTRAHVLNLDDREWWLVENQGPCLLNVEDQVGAEMNARNPGRYLRSLNNGHVQGWGYVDPKDGTVILSDVQAPIDPDFTHARGTVTGERLVRERVMVWQRAQGL